MFVKFAWLYLSTALALALWSAGCDLVRCCSDANEKLPKQFKSWVSRWWSRIHANPMAIIKLKQDHKFWGTCLFLPKIAKAKCLGTLLWPRSPELPQNNMSMLRCSGMAFGTLMRDKTSKNAKEESYLELLWQLKALGMQVWGKSMQGYISS